MFRLEDYPEILQHLNGISRICKRESTGWYQIFCPFCDDATRKLNPDHGHFHVASTYPFGHCFRCGVRVGLDQLLEATNFPNNELINKIRRKGGVVYVNHKRTYTSYTERPKLYNSMLSDYDQFAKKYPIHFNQFKNYIYHRCLDVDPIDFFMVPVISKDQLHAGVNFLNFDGVDVTTRFLSGKTRYKAGAKGVLYYFQDIRNLDECSDIVFTEGAFDLINLYNYCPWFDKKSTFFVTFGGIYYKQNVINVVKNHLMIGDYRIHIIFDRGVKNMNKITYEINTNLDVLNPKLSTNYYLPLRSKDVSDCMLLTQI